MDNNNTVVGQKAWSFVKKMNSSAPDKIAVSDGAARYTYSEMFGQWERYASVFSALGMTAGNKARVGLLGSTSAEAIFAFYGLNMVGAEVSLLGTFFSFNHKKIFKTIKGEKLTDIILTDDFAQPALIAELLAKQSKLGLRHILLLHIPIAGSTVNGMVTYGQEYKYQYMKQLLTPICMDSLLVMYSGAPIEYAENVSTDTAVIVHTSGTTSGMGKPIPLSDAALNHMGVCYDTMESFSYLKSGLVTAITIDLGNAYGIVNQVHAPFAVGGTVAAVPAGTFNPLFYKAVPEFGVTLLFCTAAILEMWARQENASMNYSSLRCVVVGGASVSAEDKRRYCDFLCRHGGKDIMFINGYGLSELGGACILSTPEINDESIGYAMPGVEICLCDDDEGRYYTADEKPCRGVMYLRSDSMTCGMLDGENIVATEEINGKRYICSNDYISIDENGKISFLGRANRYFLNNDGIKYDAGRVEAEMSRQKGIEGCAVVPVYVKVQHDNIPMLCAKVSAGDCIAAETVRQALVKVFAVDKTLAHDQIPSRVMLVDELPRNPNGKVDIFRLSNGEVTGRQFKVETVKLPSNVTDVMLVPVVTEEDDMLQDAMKAIANDIKESSASFFNNNSNREESDMKQKFNPFAFFSSANQMGSKMMGQMGQMGQMFGGACNGQQGQPGGFPFMMYGMPQPGQMPMMPMMFNMPQFGHPNQTQQMNQMNQMMAMQLNQMYMMTKQTMEMMYQNNMKMLEKMNEIIQKGLAGTDGCSQKNEETAGESTAEDN